MTAFRSLVLLTFISSGLATATPQSQALPGVHEYKLGDYTLKLVSNDTAGVMTEGASRIVGSIYQANGQLSVMPAVPEPEASKVKKAFEDWKASGKTGSTLGAPAAPIVFEADGGAVVPLQDGAIVHFSPNFVQITQPNAVPIPGAVPVNDLKITLKSPSTAGAVFKNSTGIEINGSESKPRSYSLGGPRGSRKAEKLNAAYKPILEGPVQAAAQLATSDPKKPTNALDYLVQVKHAIKRLDDSF